MNDNEEELKQALIFIQNIITRMNRNSLYIKGWSITTIGLIGAIFGVTQTNHNLLLVMLIPIILFCILDANYLRLERNFRNLYDSKIKNNNVDQVYSLKVPKNIKSSFWKALFSWSILIFYLSLAAFILLIWCLIK